MKTALSTSLLMIAATMVRIPTAASPQCQPGAVFCADIQIGGQVHVGGQVQIGGGYQYAPPPPPPPVVVYQPAPPPPPVVVYQPAPPPPPVVVYHQQPAQTQVMWMDTGGRWGL